MRTKHGPVRVLIEYSLIDRFPSRSIVGSIDSVVVHGPIDLAGIIGMWAVWLGHTQVVKSQFVKR